MGIVAGESESTTDMMALFTPDSPYVYKAKNDGAKWLYTYQIVPSLEQIAYANEHQQEFVPMIGHRTVVRDWIIDPATTGMRRCNPGTYCAGYITDQVLTPLTAPGRAQRFQSRNQIEPEDVQFLMGEVIEKLNIRPRFLMGFNEPEDNSMSHKNFTAAEAEALWSKFTQPLAAKYGLQLVSPTVNTPGLVPGSLGYGTVTGDWLVEFLEQCWNNRGRTGYPCDIYAMKRISVHMYTCMENRWDDFFGWPNGEMYTNMISKLSHHIPEVDWTAYLSERPLWVTEFNCNNDNVASDFCPKIARGEGEMAQLLEPENCNNPLLSSHEEQCNRITGRQQSSPRLDGCNEWGKGVVRWLEDSPHVERWSWWTTYNRGTAPGLPADRQFAASLVVPSRDGGLHLTEKARAILLGTDLGSTDCSYATCQLECFEDGPEVDCSEPGCGGCPHCS
jgi:hypothetical protein